jgi:hypothetical protein
MELYFLLWDISDEQKQRINVQTNIRMTYGQYEIWKHRKIVRENTQGVYSLLKYTSAIDVLEFTKHESQKQIVSISPCYETAVATWVNIQNEKAVCISSNEENHKTKPFTSVKKRDASRYGDVTFLYKDDSWEIGNTAYLVYPYTAQ